MFKKLYEKKRYSFYESFDTWEEAVKAACQPLLLDGAIENEYVDSIINSIKKYGPYVVIAPDICIPHAQEGKGVNETCVCFMKTNQAVHFDQDADHDARLFFVLASKDNSEHLKNLAELVEMLSDDKIVKRLLEARSADDLKSLCDDLK